MNVRPPLHVVCEECSAPRKAAGTLYQTSAEAESYHASQVLRSAS